MMTHYKHPHKPLVAVDCIIFGFDGQALKLLLIKRDFAPMKGKWSLMGGFIGPKESGNQAATRIVQTLTGLNNIYLEEMQAFTDPKRDPVERTISIAYLALINLQDYTQQLSGDYHAEWTSVRELPKLIFDHDEIVQVAIEKLRQKAAVQSGIFALLPQKFTFPQLHNLYESIFDRPFDNRNLRRKLEGSKLLIALKEKDKSASKKGAIYYKINNKQYQKKLHPFG